MLPLSTVKLLSRGHHLPLQADLLILSAAVALVELYLHHFRQSAAILIRRRGRMFRLRQMLGLVEQWVDSKTICMDLLYSIGNDVIVGLY